MRINLQSLARETVDELEVQLRASDPARDDMPQKIGDMVEDTARLLALDGEAPELALFITSSSDLAVSRGRAHDTLRFIQQAMDDLPDGRMYAL